MADSHSAKKAKAIAGTFQGRSGTDVWILAIRPGTLPAAVAPVVVGTAMAIADHEFRLLPALAALAGALLLQIGVNLANDYFDYVKGVDTSDRLGPVRVTQSGMISADQVRRGIIITFLLACAVGFYLISVAGWPILVVGCAAILAALCYSGGPYPLASHGLGDLFVFLFFGLVAVCGTYYAQRRLITLEVLLLSVPVGLLITAILVVNNLRDIQTDRTAGKHTLAVTLGPRGSKVEYILLTAGAYLLPILFWLLERLPVGALLSMLSLPLAVPMVRMVMKSEGQVLNQALRGTARIALIYSLFLSIGINLPF